MADKFSELKTLLGSMGKVVVAYSGGVDSTFLMKVAYDTIGDNAIAVIASSKLYPPEEIESAIKLSKIIGFRLIKIDANELINDQFKNNTPDRCYHCKKELFKRIINIAADNDIKWVLHGANADDINDYRPGQIAADELGTKAPLQEIGFTKNEIRQLSNELGLPTWNKSSFACLASRFPYGNKITTDKLKMVGNAESLLKNLGFKQFRVRHHNEIARIELEKDDMLKILDNDIRNKVLTHFKKIGYLYVTIDIEGYRTGSLNESLKLSDKQ